MKYLHSKKILTYASERSTLSVTAPAESGNGSCVSSVSEGWDSCFAAACNTRFWTSKDEGDVGSPMPFDSNFPAAHEYAWAPSLTGVSNNLQDTQVDCHSSASTQKCMWLTRILNANS